jgi:hypothetical protein
MSGLSWSILIFNVKFGVGRLKNGRDSKII